MKRALTLCGGGSLGSYEIGAVGYLVEMGMEFDIYTGTSIGALNAALLATKPYEEVASLWNQVTLNKVVKNGFIPGKPKNQDWMSYWPRLSSFFFALFRHKQADVSPFIEWAGEVINTKDVVACPHKIGIVATNFPSLKEEDILLNEVPEEDIVPYLVASCSAFPVLPVYKHRGRKYIDGGYTNNLPVDFALRLGADEVIAILLKAIPEKPQHLGLMKLPNVKAIIPSHETGGIFNFTQEKMRENRALGYLDAAKRFGKYWGRLYAFEKDGEVYRHAGEFMNELAKYTLEDYFLYENAISLEPFPLNRPVDVFLRPIEIVASSLNLDYLRPYKVAEMVSTIKKILKGDRYRELGKAFGKKLTYGLGIRQSEVPSYMAYALSVIEHNESDIPLKKASRVDPLAGILYQLSRYLYRHGLIE